MAKSTRCLVLGDSASGKTSFITQYLYSFVNPNIYLPTTEIKHYKYTLAYPSPSQTLEIVESRKILNDLFFSSVILVYNPSRPESLKYAQELYNDLRHNSRHSFGCVLVALKRGNEDVSNGKNISEILGIKFLTADTTDRMSVKRCFTVGWKWASKNLSWEDRKQAILIRENIRDFRLL